MPRGGKRNAYPEDFKRSAIELVLNDDRSISEIAKELGIYHKTLYGWVNKYKKEHGLIEQKETNDLETEIKRLRKENARLKMERDILKKATAYFAKGTM
ncbi:MAG: transposase [Sulfurovum sp.]|nr:transposase [Sulfurovum sp.]